MSDRSNRRHRLAAVALATTLLAASACSSDDDGDASPSGGKATTTTSGGSVGTPEERTCDQGATGDLGGAEAVAGSASDWTITSFDGTEIRAHWFPTDAEPAGRETGDDEAGDDETATTEAGDGAGPDGAPTILMGPGWSLAGDTSLEEGSVLFGALNIPAMLAHGYNVLTWDPRGFGESTGVASVNDPDLEGRDVQVLLDWVAEQPEARTDADGDPRVGMVGVSYGGGIQLTTAAIDCRVDALVPNIAWHSLETSLFKARTVKQGWASVLTTTASGGQLDPHITSASASGTATGTLSEEDEAWFADRGPGDLVADIDVPTLFVHGTVDTLFTLDEAITNHQILLDNDVATAMIWYCGGHGVCLTDPGDPSRLSAAAFAWLDRYVADVASAPEVAAFETLDQDGTTWTADRYPTEADETLEASGSGELALEASSAAGPVEVPVGTGDVLAGLVEPITPGPADESIEVGIDPGELDGLALGAPTVSLTYTGTIGDGDRPVRAFAQLVDDELGVVVGNQITPFALELDGEEHTVEVELEVISQRVAPGRTLTLQLVATTPAYALPRLGGTVSFESIEVTVPVVTEGLTEVPTEQGGEEAVVG